MPDEANAIAYQLMPHGSCSQAQQYDLSQLQAVESEAGRLSCTHHVQLACLMKAIQTQRLYLARGFKSFGSYMAVNHGLFSVHRAMAIDSLVLPKLLSLCCAILAYCLGEAAKD